MSELKVGDRVYWYDGAGVWGHHHGIITDVNDDEVRIDWKEDKKIETTPRFDVDRWIEQGHFEINGKTKVK